MNDVLELAVGLVASGLVHARTKDSQDSFSLRYIRYLYV